LERQTIRRKAITKLIAAVRHSEVSTAAKTFMHLDGPFQRYRGELLHTPSPLFLMQFEIAAVVEDLRRQARESADPQATTFLGRMLIGLGKHTEAGRWLALSTTNNDDAIGWAHLAITHAFSGHPSDAHDAIGAALQRTENSALVLAFAAVVRAVEAGQASDLAQSASLASESLEFLSKSRDQPFGSDLLEELEARLARGRISLLMPSDFGVHKDGIADLRKVLTRSREGLEGVPAGISELFRLHAHYFLGLNLDDHSEAIEHLQQVIVLDPACAFAENAYRRIGQLEQTP
jgi:tetratricopeptide (TPR) repeat protein